VRREGSLIRLIGVAVLGLVLMAVPAVPGAGAATITLGRTGTPNSSCGPTVYIAQVSTVAGHPSYAVPAGYGVITSWSHQAIVGGTTAKLIVWRPTGIPNEYVYQDTSPPQAFGSMEFLSFPVRIPVQPTDVLGLNSSAPCLLSDTPTVGDLARTITLGSEPAKGSPQTLTGTDNNQDLLVSAQVETDADHDDFGDDTQDKCVGSAGPYIGCPSSLSLDKPRQKGGKPKVKLTATVPGAGTLTAGSPTDPALAAAAAKGYKSVTRTLTSTARQKVVLTLKLTKSARRTLSRSGKLTTLIKVVYEPEGGPAASETRKAKLKG
jgi:hypothetical protein